MLSLRMIGALLILAGVVYMAAAAIWRGRMSDPMHNPGDTTDRTLEPRQGGMRFLGLGANWPGLAMIALGVVLLLLPMGVETPAEGPVQTPVEVPPQTPAEVPPQTPAETPADAPAETPPEAPAETPPESPAEIPPDDAPVEAPAQ